MEELVARLTGMSMPYPNSPQARKEKRGTSFINLSTL